MADVELFFEDAQAKKWLEQLNKKVQGVKDGVKTYAALVSTTIFQDVIDHFSREEGPDGKWKAWSKIYREHMERVGKGGNKILQDSGELRQAFAPTKYRSVSEGIMWFNPRKYAASHDEGTDRLPRRSFMWLSKEAVEGIEKKTIAFLLEE